METKKKDYIGLIIIALLLVSVIIFLTGICTPVQAGEMGLIQSLVKWSGAVLFSASLFALFVITMIRQRKMDIKFVAFSLLCVVLLAMSVFSSYETIKAFGAPKEVIVCSDYELDYMTPRGGAANYGRLKVETNDGSTLSIDITLEMYEKLSMDKRSIKVTYYPYIEIVDTIEYLD